MHSLDIKTALRERMQHCCILHVWRRAPSPVQAERSSAVLPAATTTLNSLTAAEDWQPTLEASEVKGGFLGTAAPRYADLVLLLEIGMGLALLVGAILARRKRFRLHAWCQSAVVLLNLAIIVVLMVPSFHDRVSPKIPAKLGKAFYALPAAHAALGSVTEIAGLYILLAAGTKILPPKFRLTRYKLWMRSVLALWWLVLLLGLATYARWYIPEWWRK